jgi:hypothetical protein
MKMQRLHELGCLILVMTIVGCGSGSITPPRTVPVSGAVLMNGQPVAGVVVRFHPQFDIGTVKYIPSAETDGQGQFTLNTGAPGNGAPIGDYVVTFEKPLIVSDDANSGIETEVDEFEGRFSDPEKSEWRITIENAVIEIEPFELGTNS